MRPRSKYYYFYEWMRERITDHFPALPEPIMDKLLAMDAGELDLLLRYPKAIRGQVEEYLDVYRREGASAETYRTPQLSWEEVKALKGQDTVGLGPQNESGLMGVGVGGGGFDSCGNRIGPKKPMLLEDAEDVSDDEHTTDRAMLGAAGDEGLTEEEAAGLVMNNSATSKRRDRRLAKYPNLPPDAQRDAVHRREARAAGDSKFLVGNDRATKGLPQREIDPDTSRRVAAILGKDASPSAAHHRGRAEEDRGAGHGRDGLIRWAFTPRKDELNTVFNQVPTSDCQRLSTLQAGAAAWTSTFFSNDSVIF